MFAKNSEVTGASGGNGAKPRRQGLLRSLRQAVARRQAFDPADIENRIGEAEKALREIRSQQNVFADDLRRGDPALAMITPLALKSEDRVTLENRCRGLTHSVYLGDHTALCRILGFLKIYLDTSDIGFASHLLLDGFWEMWLTIFLARQIQPGMTVIDVGANYGYYTLLFGCLAGPEGRVYAVEPNPTIIPTLRRSVYLNGLSARTTIIEAAAGSVEGGDIDLYAPYGEPKNGTVVTGTDRTSNSGQLYKVARITLDQHVATTTRVDLVKIDAEGAEQDIIAGMEGILHRDKPRLLLEFNAGRYADPAAFVDRLGTLYGRMRYIDFDATAREVTPQHLLSDQSGEDWLLLFDEPRVAVPTPHGK